MQLTFGESLNRFVYVKDQDPSRALCNGQPTVGVLLRKRPQEEADGQVNGTSLIETDRSVSSPSKNRKIASLSQKSARADSSSPSKRKSKSPALPQDFMWKPLLKPGLRCVFIGFNPGTVSALKGHYYAHHSNLFWKLIYESGCVDRKVSYEDDRLLPEEYGYGFTDLVSRSTAGIDELSGPELLAGVPVLEDRIRSCSPEAICFIGKGIWETVYKYKNGKSLNNKGFTWGLQPMGEFGVDHVYVFPSTSGLVGGIPRSLKLELWKQLAEFLRTNK